MVMEKNDLVNELDPTKLRCRICKKWTDLPDKWKPDGKYRGVKAVICKQCFRNITTNG